MANFGFGDLVVVAPHEPVWRETRSAVGAEEIVQSARLSDDLQAAIGDCALVVGTTSGSRRNFDRDLISLAEFPKWLGRRDQTQSTRDRQHFRPKRAALLFGSEKTGLSNEHLSFCHVLVRIPTTPDCPSMNLGQAVAVCCYQLCRPRGRGHKRAISSRSSGIRVHHSDPANLQSLIHVFERVERVLDRVGYLKPKSRAATLVKMRRLPANRMLDHLILQGEITPPDIDALSGVLSSFYKGVAPMPLSAEDYLHVFVEEHEENRRILLQVDHNLPREELELIFAAIESALAARHLIASRAETHRIVDGHGDLRPEHVCLIDPTVIIDCLEFNPRLRMVDPFDELAYLGMECRRLGAGWIGNRLIERCAESLEDHPSEQLLAFYTTYRCCLRARLAVAHLLEPKVRTPEKWIPRAREYLAIATDAARAIAR